MLHGYEKYRKSKGISDSTLKIETSLLKGFIAFVNRHNDKTLEPFEIKPSDVRAYLECQQLNLEGSTVQRKISTIRQYYHYLWKTGKVPVDFMPKFTFDVKSPEEKAIYFYEAYLSQKLAVYRSTSVTLNDKVYFLFAMRGLKMKEIEKLQAEFIEDAGTFIKFTFKKSDNLTLKLTFDEPSEINVLLQAKERALFREHDYLVSSDKKYGPDYIRGNMKDIQSRLNSVLPMRFRTEEVRLAYVYYLSTTKQKNFYEMTEVLGVSPESLTSTLKIALERYKHMDYNKATN